MERFWRGNISSSNYFLYPNKIFHAKLSVIRSVISLGYGKPRTIDDVEQIDKKVVRPQGYGIEVTDKILSA